MVGGEEPYGAIRDAVLVIREGRIAWLGDAAGAPSELVGNPEQTLDAEGGWATPGLIDCHTHLVFGGDRAREFEMRLRGASYEEIARAGGGILSTVKATRGASEDELVASASRRLATLLEHGVTTVEVKSGYGLDVPSELRMLRVARRLADEHPVTVSTTLLAAHALPPEFEADRGAYLSLICDEMIPAAVAEGLADAVDAFCEGIAFTREECARVFEAGARHGLSVRLHADQLSDLGGAALASEHMARSADHLEYASEAGVEAMAEAGVTAVVLPGAFYFLGGGHLPPIDAFRRRAVPIAIATDLNPGSSPVGSPLLAMNMACVLFGLTPEEALAGMTRNAAPVLGVAGESGTLEVGSRADIAVWSVDRPAELSYWVGSNPCSAVVQNGVLRRPA
ncbi:MAG TPA: imidazolonepropionase [Gemmatimonadetes bacterium]|jgi:imidazolonepropionase|nr:imidazolonepropionase [Gemmatimonadota bacterium]